MTPNRWLPVHRHLLLTTCLLLLTCSPALARSLYWDKLEVTARLDGDGRMHVVEHQTFVFNGAWNGGERTFNLRPGQQLTFNRLTRIDPATGAATEVRPGSLARIDRYGWDQSHTRLRWRSRLPSDPPFKATRIVYELDYILSNILTPQADGHYLLDHDFAFPERSWPINRFVLDLQLDPVWRADAGLPHHLERGRLPAGRGVVLTSLLTRSGSGRPAAVLFGAPVWLRLLLLLLPCGLLVVRSWRLVPRERALGKFAPLLPPEQVTRSWIEQQILSHPPEVIGAAWDETTSAPEVAAVLARLVQEGKLASHLEHKGFWFWRRPILHLELRVPREELPSYEGKLVRALFVGPGETTDTEAIRRHYKKTGFDPSAKINSGIKAKVKRLARDTHRPKNRAWLPTLVMFLSGLVLLGFGALLRTFAFIPTIIALAVGVGLFALAAVLAHGYRATVTSAGRYLVQFLGAALALPVALGWRLFAARPPLGTVSAIGLALVATALINSLFNYVRTLQSAERIRLRQNLTAGREFMRRELKKARPHLDDSWYPYLLAYGLGREVDHWFRAFGPDTGNWSSSSFGSAPGSSAGGPTTFTGGGGGFGGAGASAGWATAIGTVAAGVAAPSSSGGSGGGGGGSSGGGGGGGW